MKNQKMNLDSKSARYAAIGGGILLLAVIAGIVVLVLTSPKKTKEEPTPAPTPAATAVVATEAPAQPTVVPITAVHLYAYGRELDQDGFTLHVGDNPVELTAVVEPAEITSPVGWSFSDQQAATLEVSSDGRTCKITAVKPNGRNDLTVTCQNLDTSIPVYLWDK